MSKYEWISVKDELPEHNQICIVFGSDDIMIVKFWNKNNIGFGNWTYTTCNEKVGIYAPIGAGFITHWMPLPEFPNV